ncbi:hypothetical protein BN871_BS_00020 [Paenibacillus sp. P22]|nr:hypothetical protein BN871_BS_00020 [Paenibacillus sp. P22]
MASAKASRHACRSAAEAYARREPAAATAARRQKVRFAEKSGPEGGSPGGLLFLMERVP